MIRTVLTIVTGTVPLLFLGCAEESQNEAKEDAKQAQVVKEKNQPLTAEVAKKALLKMNRDDIPDLIPPPLDRPIKVDGPDEISIGIYHCNLKEKTFDASADYPKAPRHRFNHVHGVFERDAQGRWTAKVTQGVSGD